MISSCRTCVRSARRGAIPVFGFVLCPRDGSHREHDTYTQERAPSNSSVSNFSIVLRHFRAWIPDRFPLDAKPVARIAPEHAAAPLKTVEPRGRAASLLFQPRKQCLCACFRLFFEFETSSIIDFFVYFLCFVRRCRPESDLGATPSQRPFVAQ